MSGDGDVGDADGGQRSQSSGRQRTVLSPTPPPPPQLSSEKMVQVGSFYEINHSMLVESGAKYYPDQLKLVRVVSVSEKTGVSVALRFPSIYSLRNHFNNSRSNRTREGTKKLPPLDEKYVVSWEVASQLLQRRVSPAELAGRKDSWSFWAVSSSSSPTISISTGSPPPPPPPLATGIKGLLVKKGTCWSELKGGQLVQWGTRRKVQFLSRYHKETNNNHSWELQNVNVGYRPKVSEFLAEGKEVEVDNHDDQSEESEKEMAASVKDEEPEDEEEEEEEEEEEDQEEEVEEGSTEDLEEEQVYQAVRKVRKQVKKTPRQASNRGTAETRRRSSRKRKACGTSTSTTLRIKKAKSDNAKKQVVIHAPKNRILRIKKARPDNAKKQLVIHTPKNSRRTTKTSKDRWSVERYKLAEQNMLKIMREKGAVYGNPILRPALRQEARKTIGDTGLLDHLLKHMAGKVAPGGVERFRRRHNADGAMEYWLESAELVSIREDAGVQDPYWTPPPGWRPGDSPSQDPICAKELKHLRKEMAKLKGEIQELKSKKHEESLAIVAYKANQENSSLSFPLKDMYTDLLKRKSVMEEQLREVSKCLDVMKVMQEDMDGGVRLTLEGTKGTELEEPITPAGNEVGDRVRVGDGDNVLAVVVAGEEMKKTAREDKAAKIERLKSGFRICRPQGTFLWPSSTAVSASSALPPPQFAVEDLLVVPTPTPVPASPPSHRRHQQTSDGGVPAATAASPTSPVEPLAEKGVVSLAATSPEISQGLTAATGAASLTPSMGDASFPVTSVSTMEKPLKSSQHEPIEDATQAADAALDINLNELPNSTNNKSALTYKRRHQNPTAAAAAASAAISSHWERDIIGHDSVEVNQEQSKKKKKKQHRDGSSSSSSDPSFSPSSSPGVPAGGVPSWLALAAPHGSSSDCSPSQS